jgi:hypothetical protein
MSCNFFSTSQIKEFLAADIWVFKAANNSSYITLPKKPALNRLKASIISTYAITVCLSFSLALQMHLGKEGFLTHLIAS